MVRESVRVRNEVVRRWFRAFEAEWLGIWEEHLFDLREVVEDDDNVVVLVHITARGRASGLEVEFRFYAQFTLQDGKVIRIYDHEKREAALEAAGLTG